MKTKGILLVMVIGGLLAWPGKVHADFCKAAFDKAQRTFGEASRAEGQKEYKKAAQLYDQAEREFKSVLHARNCKYMATSASSNADVSRSNAAVMRGNFSGEKHTKQENSVVAVYNQGLLELTRGNTAMRNEQWDAAMTSYERAIRILKGVSSEDPSIDRQAKLGVQQAREGLAQARRMKGQ